MQRGCLILLQLLIPVGLAFVQPASVSFALYGIAVLAVLLQALGQRRFGPRFGLPGLTVLPIASAIGCGLGTGIAVVEHWGWLPAFPLAVLVALAMLLPLAWLGRCLGLREPLPPMPRSERSAPVRRAPRIPAEEWRPLGNTGMQVFTRPVGERGMGGPPRTLVHTLSVAFSLSGEEMCLSGDERWWIVGGPEEASIAVVNLPLRLLYRGPWQPGRVEELASAPVDAARLARLGFVLECVYELLEPGVWWPQGQPIPPREAAFGPEGAGLRRIALIDRQRMLEVGDAVSYLQHPDWRIEGRSGPLPVVLPHGALEQVVWRQDGEAALLPVSETLDGHFPPAQHYLWLARGEGRWLDLGLAHDSGILGLSMRGPDTLQASQLSLSFSVHSPCGPVFPEMSLATSMDGSFTASDLPWFCRVDDRGWPEFVEVGATVTLQGIRDLRDPADAAGSQPLIAEHPSGARLVFEPMGPPADPREQRPYRLCHERVVLEGISPVPRWMDEAGRFVLLQGVAGRALAPQLHLIDLVSGRVSTLRRPVVELRVQAAHDGQLQWFELLGQRRKDALHGPWPSLEGAPAQDEWSRRQADPGRFLVLRSRRARLDGETGCLRLLPPWIEVCAPVSPLQPGDVEYRPPSAPPVLLFGAHHRWQDDWPREQEPRLLGCLLTGEGHAIPGVAQGMIGSADGRWLLFARNPSDLAVRLGSGATLEDWEIALLDRRHHCLHVCPGEHFGGLPFFRAFEGDQIVFEVAEQTWWRPDVPRQRRVGSLEALLQRLDAVPLVEAQGLWRLPGDPTPARAWRAVRAAWQAGEDLPF